jgi:MoxR-like ATPase
MQKGFGKPNMKTQELGEYVYTEAGKVIAGQDEVLEQVLVCLLSRGHVLLEGVPGIAKTLIVRTMAAVLGCDFKRIQFTPDLMPSDITGTNVFDTKASAFYLKKGPVFTNLLLADEINRTPPKTQAALLQSMEEQCVSIDGENHVLEGIFFVAATQNPIEYEGTYPLPEAQLDRFMMKVIVGYPDEASELEVLKRAGAGFTPTNLDAAGVKSLPNSSSDKQRTATPQAIHEAWTEILQVTVGDDVMRYLMAITRQSRGAYQVTLGASPRASIALLKSSKALAALRGRDFVTPDDIKTLAAPVLRHRLILSPESAIEGVSTDEVVSRIVNAVPVPR